MSPRVSTLAPVVEPERPSLGLIVRRVAASVLGALLALGIVSAGVGLATIIPG